MRIAIAGINHETNTYVRDETTLKDFYIQRGEQLFRLRSTQTQTGGAIDACERLGLIPVPVYLASTQPSGTIAADCYATMKAELLERLASEMPVDAVFLDLHGAGVVDQCPDLEADLVAQVRLLVGEAVPITAAFDLHGNITQRMADALDGVFACHEYPHIDMHERAGDAIELIKHMLEGNFRPTVQVETVPILMPTTTTFVGIGLALRQRMRELEANNADVIQVSFFHGFPYSDVPQVGCHVVVTSRSDVHQARLVAQSIGNELWQQRESFRALSLSAAEALDVAQAATAKPVVINETSDNCGGGSPGDGTHLLRAMLDADLKNACFGFIVDPEVAQQAHAVGVGSSIDISLGAKYDDMHGEPLLLSVYVKALHDGRCIMQAMAKGSRINYGKIARLQIGDMDIVVASHRSQTFDTEPFAAVGIDVKAKDYIALKSSNHFRAGFEEIAGTIVTADPPGLTTHHIEVFDREYATQPLWPVDPAAAYDEA